MSIHFLWSRRWPCGPVPLPGSSSAGLALCTILPLDQTLSSQRQSFAKAVATQLQLRGLYFLRSRKDRLSAFQIFHRSYLQACDKETSDFPRGLVTVLFA